MEKATTETPAFTKGDLIVTPEYTKSVAFVTQQNGANVLRSLSALNNSQKEMCNIRIKISSVPQFFEPLYFTLNSLAPGFEHHFNNIDVSLDFDYLSTLTERVNAEILVESEINSMPLKSDVHKICVLAFDEWTGLNAQPEFLASFSTPADPAVNGIISQAAQLLKDEGLSFDGYQSNDPNVVNKQLAAIFAVVKSRNIAYSMPPASFEQHGQKIRLPKTIIDLGLATCLDTTMLLCACAEAVGINPVVYIYNGHAFPGFWLRDAMFGEVINDDLSSVKKRTAQGMNELTAIESILLTDNKSNYTAAKKSASDKLEDGSGFICYIDIARARKAGILPLPLRYENDGRFFVDRKLYDATRQKVESMRIIDVDLTKRDLTDRLEKWKRDLLDITLKNPLINYKINKAGVPLLNFDIGALEDALSEGRQLQILPHPKELGKQITDITRLNIERDERLTRILADELNNGIIRSAHNQEELIKRLTVLYRAERLALSENGASTLYLALGFLKWQEAEKPETNRFAPIILLPMEILRKSANSGYSIRLSGDELQVNLSLIEMLRVNFKIDVSGLKELPEDEKGIDIAKVFTYIRRLIIDQKDWDVVEASSLGTFHFSKFVLWNDLRLREEDIRNHPLTSALINSKTSPELFAQNPDTTMQRLYLPLDSDSSQTEAALAAAQGKTFVLHGPPGTGKSQTITNIIANALAHNRRVLFVAEKIEALNVVKRRLQKLGLFDFCLELHSAKSRKRDFYEQFDKLLELSEQASDVNFEAAAKKLDLSQAELDAFNTAMHEKKRIGKSVYEGIDVLLSLSKDSAEPFKIAQTDITKDSYEKGLEVLRMLIKIGCELGEPVNSAFYGCAIDTYSMEIRNKVLQLCKTLSDGYVPFCATITRLGEIVKKGRKAVNLQNSKNAAELDRVLGELLHYKNKNSFTKFLLGIFSRRYKAMKKSAFYRRLKRFTKEHDEEASAIYAPLNAFVAAETALNDLLRYEDKYTAAEDWGAEIYGAAEIYYNNISALRDFCIYNEYLKASGNYCQLEEIIKAYNDGALQSNTVEQTFKTAFWNSWVCREIESSELLNRFSPGEFAAKREHFKALCELVLKLTKQEIFLKLASNLPNFKYASMSGAEPGILLKAVKSRGRGITVRQLLKRIPELMSRVKPCMLMSPLSAAQFLPEDYPKFDIVIFDEASQLLTSDAAGAISRGKSTVMVGDPNQLPPTTFFSAKTDDEDTSFELQDLESILDDMLTLNILQNRLLWHYRSEHESLIAFSNANYYENKLITFPSPDDAKSRVVFKKVDGVYERGTTRTNPKEAKAVVDELFECLKDGEKSKLSYGIVTFNINQQTLIEDLIDKRLTAEPHLEKYFSSVDAPVFVKNIESVQGDERDVIFFSITYGVDKDGKMTVNFGPVNKDGGWRRLNVAITRACKRIVIFSTITPDQIDLSRTSARGVQGLKDFMSYALYGRARSVADGGDTGQTVKAVAAALREKGYRVVENMGRSSNKIDVAVQSGDGKFVLGILCDTEKKSSVRDREYGCESVLKNIGWALTRVYALEWWQNTQEETKRLISILEGKGDIVSPDISSRIQAELEKEHREVAFNPAIPLPQTEYVQANLPQATSDGFFLYNNAYIIIGQIRDVIKTEAPICEQRLFKTIAAAWDIPRMTQKFTEYLTQLVKRATPTVNTTQNTRFYWENSQSTEMTAFRTGSDRKADEIAKEEYAVAAYYIVQNAISISHEDLVRETAKLFGFTKTPTASVRIGYALSMLVVQGKLRKDGDTYKLK